MGQHQLRSRETQVRASALLVGAPSALLVGAPSALLVGAPSERRPLTNASRAVKSSDVPAVRLRISQPVYRPPSTTYPNPEILAWFGCRLRRHLELRFAGFLRRRRRSVAEVRRHLLLSVPALRVHQVMCTAERTQVFRIIRAAEVWRTYMIDLNLMFRTTTRLSTRPAIALEDLSF